MGYDADVIKRSIKQIFITGIQQRKKTTQANNNQ